MKKDKFHKIAALAGSLVATFFLIFLASVAAEGQSVNSSEADEEGASVRGIIFPVAELGGCADKNECKRYCNQLANMEACIVFAKDRGLMTEKDAERAGKFTKQVLAGNSPGGCNSPESCEEYCSNVSHLDECTGFAEKNGFKDEHYQQGKKVQSFLKSGGAMPGNCKTKQECEVYCGDFSHTKECFNFAQKAGIMREGGYRGGKSGHEPNAEQLGKIAELSERGETPGGCASKDECEKYCSDQNHRDECIDFGVKVGFIRPDEAAKIKQMGGKGPGDCNSEESCRSYCDDESRQEECFKFAEEHGFMTSEEAAQAKEGWVRARQGFENAPPEVRECMETTIGGNIIENIQSGKLVPGMDIGNQIRGCFEKFGKHAGPQEAMKNIPPEVGICLKEKLGNAFEGVRSGKVPMTPEMADSFRVCFQERQIHMGQGEMGVSGGMTGKPFIGEDFGGQRSFQAMQEMLRSAPPEVAACLKGKFPDGFPPAGTEQERGAQIKDKIRECLEGFHPAGAENPVQGGYLGSPTEQTDGTAFPKQIPLPLPLPAGEFMNMPPEVLACLKETIGEEKFQSIQTAPASLELISVVRACIEKISSSSGAIIPPPETAPATEGGTPVSFLEKFIGAALLPLRWILGK